MKPRAEPRSRARQVVWRSPLRLSPVARPPGRRSGGSPCGPASGIAGRGAGIAGFRAGRMPCLCWPTRRLFCTWLTPCTASAMSSARRFSLRSADGAGEGHLPVLDHHLDLRGVDHGIVREALVDVLADPVVRALVIARAPSAMLAPAHLATARGGIVAEPVVARPDAVIADGRAPRSRELQVRSRSCMRRSFSLLVVAGARRARREIVEALVALRQTASAGAGGAGRGISSP